MANRPGLCVFIAAAFVALVTTLPAQQSGPSWPQWRGPDRDNISKEKAWRTEGTDKLWTVQVGIGYSNVSIADGRLYTIGHDVDAGKDTIFCLEALTGKEIWTHSFRAARMAKAHGGGSLSTPSIDGKQLYVANREGKFFCFDAAKGKVRWSRNLVKKHGATKPTWGLSAAPLVLEEMIVMNVGPLLAFNRKGKLIWKSKNHGHCYSTPATFTYKNRACLAVFSGDGLTVHDRKSGREIATSKWKTRYDVNAATPVVIGNKIFISSGYNQGCAMLEFNGKKLKTLWESKDMRNHMSGCVLWENHLYGMDESTFRCLDLEGETTWSKRRFGKGALTIADGKLIALGGRGDLVIAEATPAGYKEISRAKVISDSGRLWTTPVLCGGLIYCRSSNGQLVCVDRRLQKDAQKDAQKGEAGKKKGAP